MLRQEDIAFIKVISTLQLSPAIVKELRMALSRRKKPFVPADRRSTTSGCWPRAPQRQSGHLASKREANDMASSGDSFDCVNRRPAPVAGFTALPAKFTVAGKQASDCSRQLVPPGGVVRYADFWPGPSPHFSQVGRSSLQPWIRTYLNPLCRPTANRRMPSDRSGPLIDNPEGTTKHAHVANTCLPARERPNKTPILISGVRDDRAFLASLQASCPGGQTAQ